MIENAALRSILETGTDISVVAEIYSADAVPTDDGFDPVDALDRFAAIGDSAGGTVTLLGLSYKRLIQKFGTIKRTITKEINSSSVTFSNVSREISSFEFNNGFEGLILVIRLLSRSRSVALTDTQILFAGRCEKPDSGDKDSLTVTAKFILGSLGVNIPRRKFGPEDHEGRVESDPEFEGFAYHQVYGTTTYPRKKSAGGILGILGFKKTVRQTLEWSSYSDLDANKSVPEIFGRAQILVTLIAAEDVGDHLRFRGAVCEGEVESFTAYSTDSTLPITFTAYLNGLVGTLNGPDDPDIPGNGYYSRTAYMRAIIINSAMDVTDAAPDVAALVLGRKMTIPGSDDVWDQFEWTDNAAAQAVFLLTDPFYYKLDPNWIDYTYATECYRFNAEEILDASRSDFLFVDEG